MVDKIRLLFTKTTHLTVTSLYPIHKFICGYCHLENFKIKRFQLCFTGTSKIALVNSGPIIRTLIKIKKYSIPLINFCLRGNWWPETESLLNIHVWEFCGTEVFIYGYLNTQVPYNTGFNEKWY